MREAKNCALKFTIFIRAQAFVGYCSLSQVQRNKNVIKTKFTPTA